MNRRLATIITPPLLPVLLAQGYWTKKRTPRLPDAGGPLEGSVNGPGDSIKLIVLGESTVAGIGAPTHETALTGHLASALSGRTKKSVNWLVVARSGITARESLAELVPKLSGHKADVVVIALGVNDSIAFHTSRRWTFDMEQLIKAVRREVGNSLVLLAGVPPLDHFPVLPWPLSFVLGARSASLDQASAQIARKLERVIHVPFRIEKARSRELFCPDGFHPSELGYSLWAEQLADVFADFADPPGAVARP